MRIFLVLVLLSLFLLNFWEPIGENPQIDTKPNSHLEPNGGNNPNTVAIFTARVLQVGFLNNTTNFIHNLSLFLFSIISIGGIVGNAYYVYRKYELKKR